jgi:hypothetical protein
MAKAPRPVDETNDSLMDDIGAEEVESAAHNIFGIGFGNLFVM